MANVESDQANLKNTLKRTFEMLEEKESKLSKLSLHTELYVRCIVESKMKLNVPMLMMDENDPMWLGIPKISNFFKKCQAELTAMKNHKFEGSLVDYFAFLTEPFYVLDHHVRNNHIVKEFESVNYKTLYPIYGLDLWLRFDAVVVCRTASEQGDTCRLKVFFREMFKNKYENERNTVRQLVKYEVGMNKLVFNEQELLKEFRHFELRPEMFHYYKECQVELESMKNHKFEDTLVAYYAFLKEPEDVLARYVRNSQIVAEFESKHYETLYPIYGSLLTMSFNEAVAKQKLMEHVSTILCATLQFAEPNHVAFEIIFRYLSKKDIDFIVNGA